MKKSKSTEPSYQTIMFNVESRTLDLWRERAEGEGISLEEWIENACHEASDRSLFTKIMNAPHFTSMTAAPKPQAPKRRKPSRKRGGSA